MTTRLDRVLADPDVDAVLIATPVHTHYKLAAQALAAGKHVFVEKPLAQSSELADDLVALARERGLILMCGHTFLYSPPVRAVKRMIEAGTLGDIFFISSSRVNLGLHQRDVSVIWDLGPHDFSILLYWLSEIPTTVRAVGRDSIVKGIADVAFVTMTFASGIVVNVELSWLAPSKLRRTVLVGSERMVIYDDGAPEPVRAVRSRRGLPRPGDVRRVPPVLPQRRRHLAHGSSRTSRSGSSSRFRQGDSDRRPHGVQHGDRAERGPDRRGGGRVAPPRRPRGARSTMAISQPS